MPRPATGIILTIDTVVDEDAESFRIIHLDPDGSRRITASTSTDGNLWNLGDKERVFRSGPEALSWGAAADISGRDTAPGLYLPYLPDDGIAVVAQEEPVNQYGYLPLWKAHVARFAHGFDILPGFESFKALSASKKVTAYRVGQTIAGAAWSRLGFWTTYDAALSDDWKSDAVFLFVKKVVDAVCDERCASDSGARRLALSISYTEFEAKLEAGHIHGTNRDVTPWTPGTLLTIVPTPDEETTIETAISGLIAGFNGARDYYDTHVAHQVVEHDH